MKRQAAVVVGLSILCAAAAGAATSGRQTLADVEVRVDGQGRLALLIDEVDSGGRADGLVDRVVLYTPTHPVRLIADLRIVAAAVFISEDRVAVRSKDGWRLLLEIREDQPEVQELGAAGIELRNGIGLQVTSGSFGDGPRSFAEIDTDDWATVTAEDGDSGWCRNDCQSGGPGASTCSQHCEWAMPSGTLKQQCTVKCNKGKYACCCCTGAATASCTCRQETTTPAPAGARLEPELR